MLYLLQLSATFAGVASIASLIYLTEGTRLLTAGTLAALSLFLFRAATRKQETTQARVKRELEVILAQAADTAKNERAVNAVREVRNRKLKRVPQIVSEAKSISSRLSESAERAREAIERAEFEHREGMLDPFWDAVEVATNALAHHDQTLKHLTENSRMYRQVQSECSIDGPALPEYPVSRVDLPNVSGLSQRLRDVVRRTQTSPEFTTIYHLRRTNSILIAGFTTFGQALSEIGGKLDQSFREVTDAIDSVNISVRNAADRTVAAVRDASELQERGVSALLESIRDSESTVKAEGASTAERVDKIADTLDNIQRGRTPADFEFKPGTVKREQK